MADPVNFAGYLGQAQQLVPNFQEALLREQLGGLQAQQIGLQNQQIAADTRLTEAKMQQALVATQQQEEYSREFEAAIASGDPRAIASVMARYPGFGDQVKATWDRLDSRIRDADLRDMGQIYAAANGGRYDLAASALRRRIEADKAADGQADPGDEAVLELLESQDPAQQKRGLGMVGVQLAAITGPEKFASTYGTLAEGEAGFTLSPGARRFDKDGNIIAEAPFAPRTVTVGEGQTVVEYDPNGRGGGPASGGGGGAGGSGAPRNVRNNNPGNIIDSQFARSQPGYVRSDGRFAVFETPEAGRAAQGALLGSYIDRGFNTVEKIINRWAPPSENDTGTYVRNVARELGVDPRAPLGKAAIPKLAAAITRVEGGPGGSSAGVPAATTGGGTRIIAQGRPKQEDAPSGYRWNANGTALEPIPGGPATRSNNAPGSVNRKAEADLRKQFDALPEVKRFKGIRAAREQVRAIVTKKDVTAQDDIALIFAYMKMLDPDSVVREGEFATAQNATGVPDQVRNQFNKVMDGTRLNAEQRRNIAGLVDRLYQSERSTYNSTAETYRGYANDYGINPDRIARRYVTDAQNGKGAPVRVRSVQEAQKLPAGTTFIAPNGRTYRKK